MHLLLTYKTLMCKLYRTIKDLISYYRCIVLLNISYKLYVDLKCYLVYKTDTYVQYSV
jgi:hypothetical protein